MCPVMGHEGHERDEHTRFPNPRLALKRNLAQLVERDPVRKDTVHLGDRQPRMERPQQLLIGADGKSHADHPVRSAPQLVPRAVLRQHQFGEDGEPRVEIGVGGGAALVRRLT